ncbi:MAG: carboxymuconolactone decarboxylase family protein [Flammeovirgaceae bacterium]|nr:carboxymuconolactone decarboxylase family protein [Flammeovirgaceae bacterium]
MKTIQVPSRNQVDSASQGIFDNLQKALGTVPNLYATIGYSSNALDAYLTYSQATDNGVFSKKEAEAIKLAVSEVNECQYCLAAHTVLAKMNGFSEEETLALRAASISDKKLNVITHLAREIAQERGKASDEAKQAFFDAGYDEKALIDLVAIVVDITFTNYTHRLTQVPVDFPTVKPLGAKVAA